MFNKIVEILRREIGLDPSSAGEGPIRAAVHVRMVARGLHRDQLDDYLQLLHDSREELKSLIDQVVIPESWFLRDRIPFDFLAEVVSQQVASRASHAVVRVLSIPCASGEEPYSAAIRLHAAGIDRSRVEITGVDVSSRAIERARAAVYTANALRNEGAALRETYFRQTDAGLLLRPEFRQNVRLLEGNLIDPQLLAPEAGTFDVVMCRNVLIYFDAEARSRALQTIDRLLTSDGILFVGHAEPLMLARRAFRPVGPRGAFAYQRTLGVSTRESATAARQGRSGTARVDARANPVARQASPLRRVETHRTEAAAPPSSLSPGINQQAGPRIEEAARLAGEGQLQAARRLCELDLAERGPSASGYALLGMLRQAQGDLDAAESLLQKAVYLDANHEDALLGLAALAQRRGDLVAAANFRRRASRAYDENRRVTGEDRRP